MNENLPQVIQEGFFTKIKNWFLKIFRKQKKAEYLIEDTVEKVYSEVDKSNKEKFIQNIKVEDKEKIIMLQRKIKEKQIEISDLTNEELDEMIELYKSQIEEKKVKLQQYRVRIRNIKKDVV